MVDRQAGAPLDRVSESIDAAPVAALFTPTPTLPPILLLA